MDFVFQNRRLNLQLYEEAMLIPNLCHTSVAKGNFSSANVVRCFGKKRKDGNLETAESIAKAWKTLYNPLNACGERSYAFIGTFFQIPTVTREF